MTQLYLPLANEGVMTRRDQKTVLCSVCGTRVKLSEVLPVELVRGAIIKAIQEKIPELPMEGSFICLNDLNRFRKEYIEDVLEEERGTLSRLEQDFVASLAERELLSKNINIEFERDLTFGEKMADKVAEIGGSWGFIFAFAVVVAAWIIINSLFLLKAPFDPYPYILLNLVLSCLAAIQAPIIMMSQNRQDAKDRLRSEYDYKVNLKAELEIRHLNERIDLLLRHQWQRLLEIQQIQIDILEEFANRRTQPSQYYSSLLLYSFFLLPTGHATRHSPEPRRFRSAEVKWSSRCGAGALFPGGIPGQSRFAHRSG